ncbi:hypothetical protein B0H66DRAFT_534611 [Apodospora peruviana]|uniref:Uncharacterized protein n=1 Tax=Apodospora peruviana TaxID=516989 RepID=A0AAE0I0N9_9PEZI|nr:hypothetical protein B0H66DRAFT_534611 [Apodospora peruviana]
MEILSTPSPQPPSNVHTPPAPVHGYEDSWAPYSPRKSARLSQRAANRTPSPHRFSSRQHLDRPSLGSPKTSKRHPASSMATPVISPQKKRAPATAEPSRRVSDTLTADGSLLGANAARGRPGVSTNGGMLITPAKTPQKPPTEQAKAKIHSVARNLFHPEIEVMPSPKKTRVQKYVFDSFSAEDEIEEPIQIYTDSHERVPEIDRSAENPFYVDPAAPPQPALRRSKRQTVAIPGEGNVSVEEAVGRTDGMVTVFRGKTTFRKFAQSGEVARGNGEVLDGADGGLESVVESRFTRATVKPRLLFPTKVKQPKDVDEDEEAVTDIEDHVLEGVKEHDPITPMDLVEEERASTPEAPRFAPASPPTTDRTTRFGANKGGDASPVKPKPAPRGKRSPFDGWRRVKGSASSESSGHKRAGDALPTSPAKRNRV